MTPNSDDAPIHSTNAYTTPYSRPHAGLRLGTLLLPIAILALALLGGIVVGLGNYTLDALAFAALFGVVLLLLPLEWLVTVHFVIAVVITGCIVYFLRIQQANWLPFGSALLVGVKVLLTYLTSRQRHANREPPSALILALGAYIAGIFIAVVANRLPLLQSIVGLKTCCPAGRSCLQ